MRLNELWRMVLWWNTFIDNIIPVRLLTISPGTPLICPVSNVSLAKEQLRRWSSNSYKKIYHERCWSSRRSLPLASSRLRTGVGSMVVACFETRRWKTNETSSDFSSCFMPRMCDWKQTEHQTICAISFWLSLCLSEKSVAQRAIEKDNWSRFDYTCE